MAGASVSFQPRRHTPPGRNPSGSHDHHPAWADAVRKTKRGPRRWRDPRVRSAMRGDQPFFATFSTIDWGTVLYSLGSIE
jgi:hypothetical protein